MYTASNGMNAHSHVISVISDNVANINTPGFKESLASLQDFVSAISVREATNVGQGSTVSSVFQNFTQGSIQPVGGTTNLAIQGNGFFIVNGTYNGEKGNFYTRDGGFHIDNEGSLINQSGLMVQGYQADPSGNISGALSNLKIINSTISVPHPTEQIKLSANLSSSASLNPNRFNQFDIDHPRESTNFSASLFIYDSVGQAHNLDMYFRASGQQDIILDPNDPSAVPPAGNAQKYTTYEWHAVVKGEEVDGSNADSYAEIGFGRLQFTPGGLLHAVTTDQIDANGVTSIKDHNKALVTANFKNAIPNQKMNINFGDPTSIEGSTGLTGVTCFSDSSNITGITQDGYSEGSLSSLSVDSLGTLIGVFTNGNSIVLGRLALAIFNNLTGLQRIGGSLYRETLASGQASLGPPNSGTSGMVISGALEASNVDIASQFIRLIAYERGFQANTRSIRSSNEMLLELVNIGR
jgi:flagellar hook protein FlgE